MAWSDFMEDMTGFTQQAANFGSVVGDVVQEVNNFELPTVKTQHNVGVDGKTIGLIAASVAFLVWLFRGKRKRKKR